MKINFFSRFVRKLLAPLCAAILPALFVTSANAQTYFNMSSGDYTENFSSITNTNTWVTPSTGSWQGLQTNSTGSIPSATRITATTTNFVTGSSGGAQRGTNGTLQLLATGSTDNSSSTALDLLLNFAGRNAGNLGFDAAQVANSTGNRVGTLRAYYTTDGTTWSEITGGGLPFAATNNVASSNAVSVALPAAINNSPTVQLRFYYNNGTGGSTGSRPKISIDNVLVTSTPAGTAPLITSFSPSSGLVGSTVTINGFNFGATPAVRFNGVAAASPVVNGTGTQMTVFVPSGATTGKITVEVAGQDTATSATDFTVIPPGTPLVNLSTNSITGLNTSTGSPSAATNYTVTGTNLGTTAVTITPDSALLEVGTNGTNFASSLSLTPSGGAVSNSIFLRVVATNVVTNYSASISHVSGSASNSLAVSGAITNLPPGLVANPTNITGLNAATTNVPSAAQTFALTGSNLTNDVAVSAPAGFEVANDGATWGTTTSLTQTGGSVNGTISVRLAASSAFGPRSGNVTNVSGGITNRVPVSGSVPVPDVSGQIYWNFDAATPTSGTGGDYATWTFPAITQNNNNGTTALLTTTSVSSGYTNPFNVLASGTTNAGAAARVGGFDASTNAFFEVQIVVPTSTTTSITNISFGSRSTGTGPAAYSIRSSVDGFASDVVTNALTTNSVWGMYVAPVSIALSNGTNTIRIYGYGSAAASSATGTANWRVDDLTVALGTGTGPNPPSGLSYTPSSANGVVGTAITNMVPVVTGTVTNYSVDPALPSGLAINPTTGVISGTPAAVAASANYTVTASNAGGSTAASVTIAVVSAYDGWASSYSLSGPSALPTADPDNDGLNNNNEYAFGTNPTVANASLMSATTTSGNMTVSWIERNSGFTYAVQSTTNLATTAFANDGSVTPTTTGNQAGVPTGYTRKEFTVSASNNKFFRVRATPAN